MKKAVAITITGRVQNVGFRYSTRKMAEKYNISGFVKNESDGSVYAEAVGSVEDIDRFVLWCYSGPSWARVDNVHIQALPVMEFDGFQVR